MDLSSLNGVGREYTVTRVKQFMLFRGLIIVLRVTFTGRNPYAGFITITTVSFIMWPTAGV